MDTVSAAPAPDTVARLIALEQQMALLDLKFAMATACVKHIFEAGRESVLSPPLPQPRTRHLRLIQGGGRPGTRAASPGHLRLAWSAS